MHLLKYSLLYFFILISCAYIKLHIIDFLIFWQRAFLALLNKVTNHVQADYIVEGAAKNCLCAKNMEIVGTISTLQEP